MKGKQKLPGNHEQREVGPVTLMCMAPEARGLMELALKQYREHRKNVRKIFPKDRESVYSFAYWLFRWSGLIDASGKAR